MIPARRSCGVDSSDQSTTSFNRQQKILTYPSMSSIPEVSNDYAINFLYGNEDRNFSGFCLTAAKRIVCTLPLCVAFSNSLTVACLYTAVGFWLFAGQWKRSYSVLCSSGLLLASVPLIIWTFVFGVRFDGTFFESLGYWFGHFPYLFIILFATLAVKRPDRGAMLSSVNLGITVCCVWAMFFFLSHLDYTPEEILKQRLKSIHLFRNTICFGMALVIWAGLWAFFPFSSRRIPRIRRILPKSILFGMSIAARSTPIDFVKFFVTGKPGPFRQSGWAWQLTLLRWSIVVGVPVYLVLDGSSRTALIAILSGYGAVLLAQNWKRGLPFVLISVLFVCAVVPFSNKLHKKIDDTFGDAREFYDAYSTKQGLERLAENNPHSRVGILAALIPFAMERPMFGYGIAAATTIVKRNTSYNDPHNEFFYFQLYYGAAGLALFLIWMSALFIHPSRLQASWRPLGLFIAVIVFVGCLFNNILSYHRETLLLCMIIACIATAPCKRKD